MKANKYKLIVKFSNDVPSWDLLILTKNTNWVCLWIEERLDNDKFHIKEVSIVLLEHGITVKENFGAKCINSPEDLKGV